jgi:hypothetical protein
MPVAEPLVGTKGVAPTMVFTAPRAATEAMANFSTAPTGEAVIISSPTATRFTAGMRCSNTMRRAPGSFIQWKWRWRRTEIFMGAVNQLIFF